MARSATDCRDQKFKTKTVDFVTKTKLFQTKTKTIDFVTKTKLFQTKTKTIDFVTKTKLFQTKTKTIDFVTKTKTKLFQTKTKTIDFMTKTKLFKTKTETKTTIFCLETKAMTLLEVETIYLKLTQLEVTYFIYTSAKHRQISVLISCHLWSLLTLLPCQNSSRQNCE